MNEHRDPYFLFRSFGVQIVPLELEKLKKTNSTKGKKDMAESVHKARHSMMQIMTLKASTRGTF